MKKFTFCAAVACAFGLSQAAFPTAAEIQKNMGMGFNIGNSMEVPNNPTDWDNPLPTQDLMDSIKAAGFNTVRIPCAWDSHASNGVISTEWMNQVKQVVDYALTADLYVILNIHNEGKGGWFQYNIGTSVNDDVNTKLASYWTQIATTFKDYNEKLLFAGANEPGSNIGDDKMTQEHVNTLMSYFQTFVTAVRATGGNNLSRALIIQGPNTNIDNSIKFSKIDLFPKDVEAGHIMFEVHYYSPYQYALMTEEQDWGAVSGKIMQQYYYGDYQKADEPKRNAGYTESWWDGNPNGSPNADLACINYPNSQFAKLKSTFVDAGYPVIIGEFGALKRNKKQDQTIDEDLHNQGRVQWHKDVATAAKANGITPILWDMGNEADTYDNLAYIRRQTQKFGGVTGQVVDLPVINALRGVYGLGEYENKGVTHVNNFIQAGAGEIEGAVVPEGNLPTAIALQQKASGVSLVYHRNVLMANGVSNASIQLFDLNGNLLRTSAQGATNATMNLDGVRPGVYLAKYSSKVLKISVK